MSAGRGLLLVFPDGDDGVAWARPRGKGRAPEFGCATAAEPLKVAGGERLVLLAPGEDVTLHAVDLPVRGAQALNAARFAVEDDLAQPVEDLEVVLGLRGKTTRREIAVVARETLDAWTAALAAAGAEADMIAVDYAALPVEAGAILIVERDGRVMVRGEGIGLAVDAALAPAVLGALLKHRPDDAITLRSDRADALLPRALQEGRRLTVHPAPSDAELVELFAEGLEGATAIDLASQKRNADAAVRLKDWRLALGFAGAAAAAFVAVLAAETVSFHAHAEAAEADAARMLNEAFPDAASAAEARSASRGGGSGSSFLMLSGLLAESIAEIPTMQIESLRFDEAGDGLAVSVAFAVYDDVQKLRAAIEARGGRLTEGASRTQNGRLIGDMTVERP